MAHGKLGQPQTRRLGDLLVAEGLITEAQLRQALAEQKGKTEKHYEAGQASMIEMMTEITADANVEVLEGEAEGAGVDVFELKESADEAPVVKLVNMVLVDAIRKGASDLHWEPYEKHFRIRFRIDGVLHEMLS